MPNLDYLETFVWPDRGWHLQWLFSELDPNYTIRIQRSEGPEGPWKDVTEVNAETITYDDRDLPYRSLFTVVWYRLLVEDENGDVVFTSDPSTNKRKADRITAEVIRQYEIRLQGTNGHPGHYSRFFACFKRAVDGITCDCVDDVSGDRVRDRCPLCLGTGYLEGWSNPITFRGRFLNGETRNTRISRLTESENLRRQMWTAHYPLLEPGDVLVEKDNARHWKVLTINVSDPNGVVVSQRANMELMDRENIENELFYPGDGA